MLDFILNNLPIVICVVVGIVLLVIEIFMPGFGIPGISGTILLVVAIYLTWKDYGTLAGLGATVAVIALAGIMISVSLKSASTGRISRSSLILKGSSSKEEGYQSSENKEGLLGKSGIALTVLRPSGIAEFAGERINIVSRGEFIDKGAHVKIIEVEGARVVVERIEG